MLHLDMVMLQILMFAASSAAQAQVVPAPSAPPPAMPVRRGGGRLFISPMGEPFRPVRDESGLADWFSAADSNRDGRLTLEEVQADGDRFFALLDVNHDGEIDPDEIERYETVVVPEISGGSHFEMIKSDDAESDDGGDGGQMHRSGRGGFGGGGYGGGGHRGGGGHHGGGRSDRENHQGAARFGLLDLPEPVTAADTNFNRGISRDEFRQAAVQRFLALDLDHHGYLTLAGLQAIRPAPPARPNRNETPGEPPAEEGSAIELPPG